MKWFRLSFLFAIVFSLISMSSACSGLSVCEQDSHCNSGQVCQARKCVALTSQPAEKPVTDGGTQDQTPTEQTNPDPGHNSSGPTTQLQHYIKEQCVKIPMEKLKDWTKVEIEGKDGMVHIRHNLSTHCAAKLSFSLEVKGNTLKVIEENKADNLTRCTCGYQLTMKIAGLKSGSYNVEVWGVKFKDQNKAQKLGSSKVTIKR